MMRYTPILVIILSSMILSTGCAPPKTAKANKQEMTRCQEELSTIPEVAAAALNKSRIKRPDDTEESIQGMEIALTINRMIRSKVEPDRDQDDWCYTQNTKDNFRKVLEALKANGIPPTVDFVAGASLDQPLQEEWLRSGNLIGSMTYAERSIKKRTTQEFVSDWSRNEEALASLWSKFDRKHKYFRFPGLKVGIDQKPLEIRAFLKQNGYIEVPATIDSRDDSFSQPYCAALARGDNVCANFIGATFKSLLLDKTIKARAASARIVGRDVKHILMIQANQLTCDMLDELLHWYKAMGVKFVSLDDALSDPFYAVDDVTNRAKQIIRETKRAQLGTTAAEE